MSDRARPWAPLEVALRPAVREGVQALVSGWTGKWMANESLKLSLWELKREGADPPANDGHTFGGGVRVDVAPRAWDKLVRRALKLDIGSAPSEPLDQEVLQLFGERLFNSLASEMERGLIAARPSSTSELRPIWPGVRAGLADASGDIVIGLSIPFEGLRRMAEASLPAPRSPKALMSGRLPAIADHQVMVQALLGNAKLRVADARTLAPGDVLVLDRSLSAPAELRLVDSGAAVAAADLTDSEGRAALRIQSTREF